MQPVAGLEDWEVTCALSNALGYPMEYEHPREIMARLEKGSNTNSHHQSLWRLSVQAAAFELRASGDTQVSVLARQALQQDGFDADDPAAIEL